MISTAAVRYLRSQLVNHARLFFEPSAGQFLRSDAVRFLPYAEAIAVRHPQLVVPIDLQVPDTPNLPWKVEFNGTTVTLWNRIPNPDSREWHATPNEATPVWYQHTSGTVVPAWNLFGNAFDLLTYGEEKRSSKRDHHGRFAAAFSPRLECGLLEVPAINETVALLVAALQGMSITQRPAFHLEHLVRPPVVVLSHDCDILLGNDLWTQSVRLYRTVAPLARFKLPRPGNLWWMARNTVTPRAYYFDNALGMADLERIFGYTSTYYLLNGTGGRFGARSPLSAIGELIQHIPAQWDLGIHYNYDTFLNEDRFASQLLALRQVTGRPIVSGRAHYLKFDPFQSFAFLQRFGICSDESSGYPDRIGYRNGIAGCFQAFDVGTQSPLPVWEAPLVIMEAALVEQYRSEAVAVVKRHLQHLSRIGGALTILVHPGQFFNPEDRQMLGIYHELLKACREVEAISMTAQYLADRAREGAVAVAPS